MAASMTPGQPPAPPMRPVRRDGHTAVWTGSEMIVWGGYITAATFEHWREIQSQHDSWTATSTTNAPAARANHTAVWTGSEMIVWGGYRSDGSL